MLAAVCKTLLATGFTLAMGYWTLVTVTRTNDTVSASLTHILRAMPMAHGSHVNNARQNP